MGIKRLVKLVHSSEISTPMVFGVIKPCLIMPTTLISGLTPDQLTAVFAHELAHLRRNDFLQNLLQTLIETAFFFHPGVWWISNVIRTERENLCDDLSVDVVGKPICLAEALATIQAMGGGTRELPLAQAATPRRGSTTLRRIRRLIDSRTHRNPGVRSPRPIVLRALAAIGLIAGLAALAPLSIAMQNNSEVSEDQALPITENGREIESWEISKLYDSAFLRNHLQDHEVLPKPIVVPPVRGIVIGTNGKPVDGAKIVSHTPRHWVQLNADLSLKPHNSGGVRKSKTDGTFGLPERTEPYRVLVVHESGVANVSHEELLNADGKVVLQAWASVSGTLSLEGKPQPDETVVLYFNTMPWSYSRGGPRLTTEHQTKTDADGTFSFDRVPPLGGMAHQITQSRTLARGIEFQCESGKETQIEMGVGTTVRGKLDFVSSVDRDKLRVIARPVLNPIPYPPHLSDESLKEQRRVWRREWLETKDGQAFSDRNHVLMNSNTPATIASDGRFVLKGVPSGPMQLLAIIPGEQSLAKVPFNCSVATDDGLDLGTIRIGNEHDHDHADVKARVEEAKDGVADDVTLPRLNVRAVDTEGNPVSGVRVLFFDRDNFFSRQELAFENMSGRTDQSGTVGFGEMPHDFGCLELSHPKEQYADCYTLIHATMTKCTQANPPRANVATEIKDGELTVTFTMTPHVDLEFNIVDDATDEIVFWSELYYQDSKTNRWWTFGLVDGSKRQHNFIPISPQMTKETIRISAQGYETKTFQLPGNLDWTQPIRHDIRLEPMPDVQFKIMLPNGKPAEGVRLRLDYPDDLRSMQISRTKSDAQGIIKIKFPSNSDVGMIHFEHSGGSAKLAMKDLLTDAESDPSEVIQRSVQLNE